MGRVAHRDSGKVGAWERGRERGEESGRVGLGESGRVGKLNSGKECVRREREDSGRVEGWESGSVGESVGERESWTREGLDNIERLVVHLDCGRIHHNLVKGFGLSSIHCVGVEVHNMLSVLKKRVHAWSYETAKNHQW